jgi:hypothetical protein
MIRRITKSIIKPYLSKPQKPKIETITFYLLKPVEMYPMKNKVQILLTGVLAFLKACVEPLRDGFQWYDLIAMAKVPFQAKSIISDAIDTFKTPGELTLQEVKELADANAAEYTGVFWTDNNIDKEAYGIDALVFVLNMPFELIRIVKNRLIDGLGFDDIRALPEVGMLVYQLILHLKQAYRELCDLSKPEIDALIKELTGNIASLFVSEDAGYDEVVLQLKS